MDVNLLNPETVTANPVSNEVHDTATAANAQVPRQSSQVAMLDSTSTPAELAKDRFWITSSQKLPALAGLLVSGVVISSLALPKNQILSWTQFLGFALELVLAASVIAVVSAAAVGAAYSRRRAWNAEHLLKQTSLSAVWLAPLVLFIREDSLWTMLLAAIFAVAVSRSLIQPRNAIHEVEPLIFSLHPGSLAPGSNFNLQLSAAAALLAQTGALALLAGYAVASAILIGTGFAVWTWTFGLYAPTVNASPRSSQSRSAPAVFLAVLLTAVALIPLVKVPGGLGSSPRRPWDLFTQGHGSGHLRRPTAVSQDADAPGSPGSYGILLWPEKQTYTKLIAPTPAIETGIYSSSRNSNPLVIPFNGVYWFFKAPDLRPPENSRQAQASPDKVVIRSTDRRPLSIEAHDNLGSLIALDCCRQIQIAIRNADRYPETVSLELILIDTSVARKPFESLGKVMVKSTRPWSLYQKQQATDETLSFAIPPRSSLRQFDEVKIIFRLDPVRADTGARIAIDHLVLVPRQL